MSKRAFKASASSGRVVAGFGGFGSTHASPSSVLSYIQEPLDFQSISDPTITVILKNLQKRDETTKAKALDDLQGAIDELEVLDDALLEIWIRQFPRLSIDNSRRVRQLAQSVNGKVCVKAGKRIAKHMPQIIGPWLAALYDNDRTVVKSAQDALTSVFPETEKVAALRKVYHQALVEYCRNAALHESVSSLSDERVVNKDDAENTYARVVSSSLALISSLINRLGEDDLEKFLVIYQDVLDTKTIEFATHSDAGIRKATHQVIRSAVVKLNNVAAEKVQDLSKIYVYKGTHSDQTGSALDFVTTLVILTQNFPTIWTDAYTGKKSATSRLSHLLKQGSQGASSQYWVQLSLLITSLPVTVVSVSSEEVKDLLASFRRGLSRKEERFQSIEGWQVYRTLIRRILECTSAGTDVVDFKDSILPVLSQYLFPTDDAAEWHISGPKSAPTVAGLLTIPEYGTSLAEALPSLVDTLIETMKTSQPEQSKDYERSQQQVAKTGERWSSVQKEMFATSDLQATSASTLLSENCRIISEALSLTVARNGKPFGSAAVVGSLLQDCGQRLLEQDVLRQELEQFVVQSLPQLLFSSSGQHLVRCLLSLQTQDNFDTLLSNVLVSITSSDEDLQKKLNVIDTIYSTQLAMSARRIAQDSAKVQDLIISVSQEHGAGNIATLSDVIDNGIATRETQAQLFKQFGISLRQKETAKATLKSLQYLADRHHDLIANHDTEQAEASSQLMPNLLRLLEDEDDEVASLAQQLSTTLTTSNGQPTGPQRFAVIRHALQDTGTSSTSIEVLNDFANKLLSGDETAADFLTMFPNWQGWKAQLVSHLSAPASSSSICSAFGGAVYLVRSSDTPSQPMTYDVDGLTSVLRMASFFVDLLSTTSLSIAFQKEDPSEPDSLLRLLILTAVTTYAAQDGISVPGTTGLSRADAATAAYVIDIADKLNTHLGALKSWLAQLESQSLLESIEGLIDSPDSPLAYYLSITRTRLLAMVFDLPKHPETGLVKSLLSQPVTKIFTTCSDIATFTQIAEFRATITKLANEIVADLTSLDYSASLDVVQGRLILLNTIFSTDDTFTGHLAKQRVIFLVKHLLAELENTQSQIIGEEGLRALTYLLPLIPDVYGEHWGQVLSMVLQTWSDLQQHQREHEHLPTLYYTLRLYATLRKLSAHEDVNEDLLEVLEEKESTIAGSLVGLLKTSDQRSDTNDQPLTMTNELLAMQIMALQPRPKTDLADLLPLFYIPSRAIQEAVFSLAHDQIPKVQEQVSLEAALDNKTAKLPDELLSILLETPLAVDYDEGDFVQSIPAALQTYLNSWRLLFDYFNSSSYKVKMDYSDQLKDGSYLAKLLAFTFDFLGHARGKAIDVAGDVTNYQAGLETNALRDVRWLLAHLYYLSLLHLPSLVKSYVLDLRSRAMPALIEEWTAKNISPEIITTSLQAVSEWSEKTVNEDPEYEKMSVKVGTRSKEVSVKYVVDEQTMAIKVILPDAYPLAPALVVGVSRVAVKEEKWQSWLRNCQGVITFSNGSITDGLAAWRRNVTGALKGQTECAICYSIISADKQLPTKKCPTCKNLFHSSCLFKWFKTSNASTCPLCRNSFNFN